MLYQAGGDRRARMRVFTSPSELEAAVGAELGVSGWFTVGQDRIDAFAEATGDRQWIHVDVERARRESPYPATLAGGGVRATLETTVEREGADRPACVAETLAVHYW